jgi:hypothetical protein
LAGIPLILKQPNAIGVSCSLFQWCDPKAWNSWRGEYHNPSNMWKGCGRSTCKVIDINSTTS